MDVKEYQKDEVILKEGERSQYFYVIMQGDVQIFVNDKGKEKVITEFTKGDYFGEVELFLKQKNIAEIRAKDDKVKVGRLTKELFEALIRESSEIKEQMEQVAKLRKIENDKHRKNI